MAVANPTLPAYAQRNEPGVISLDERFVPRLDKIYMRESLLLPAVNKSTVITSRDFSGVRKVRIRTFDHPETGEYNPRDGDNAYGATHDANSDHNDYSVDESLTVNEGFDKTDMMDTQGFLEPSRWLADYTRVRIVPTLDLHGFTALVAHAQENGNQYATIGAISANAYYHRWLDSVEQLKERQVDCKNAVGFISTSFMTNLKKDNAFSRDNEIAQKEIVIKGAVGMKTNYMFDGMIDGIPVKQVPSDRMPANTHFILARQDILAQPRKIYDFRILTRTLENRAGAKILGLVWFDSIVPKNAGAGIQISKAS